jgi:hypothetical protein
MVLQKTGFTYIRDIFHLSKQSLRSAYYPHDGLNERNDNNWFQRKYILKQRDICAARYCLVNSLVGTSTYTCVCDRARHEERGSKSEHMCVN